MAGRFDLDDDHRDVLVALELFERQDVLLIALMQSGERPKRARVLATVTGAVQPNDQTVAHQAVDVLALEVGDVLHEHLGAGLRQHADR